MQFYNSFSSLQLPGRISKTAASTLRLHYSPAWNPPGPLIVSNTFQSSLLLGAIPIFHALENFIRETLENDCMHTALSPLSDLGYTLVKLFQPC